MPEWPWPVDVVFDHFAAQRAIDAVETARHQLERDWDREQHVALRALATWDGMAAAAFQTSLQARGHRVQAAVVELRHLQVALEDAAADARRAEDLVELRREHWRQEQWLEQQSSDQSDEPQDFAL
ncbi:MAG: hypothetical protein ACR2PK_01735 [Acidimicrobiales bacterium]